MASAASSAPARKTTRAGSPSAVPPSTGSTSRHWTPEAPLGFASDPSMRARAVSLSPGENQRTTPSSKEKSTMRLSLMVGTTVRFGLACQTNNPTAPARATTTRAPTRAPAELRRPPPSTSSSPRMRPHSEASSPPEREDSMSATEVSTKTMRCAPTRMRELWRRIASTTGSPSTRVPLVDPRSRRTKPFGSRVISQWTPETEESSKETVLLGRRPKVVRAVLSGRVVPSFSPPRKRSTHSPAGAASAARGFTAEAAGASPPRSSSSTSRPPSPPSPPPAGAPAPSS